MSTVLRKPHFPLKDFFLTPRASVAYCSSLLPPCLAHRSKPTKKLTQRQH